MIGDATTSSGSAGYGTLGNRFRFSVPLTFPSVRARVVELHRIVALTRAGPFRVECARMPRATRLPLAVRSITFSFFSTPVRFAETSCHSQFAVDAARARRLLGNQPLQIGAIAHGEAIDEDPQVPLKAEAGVLEVDIAAARPVGVVLPATSPLPVGAVGIRSFELFSTHSCSRQTKRREERAETRFMIMPCSSVRGTHGPHRVVPRVALKI
jgi:hypothetical protein